MKPLLKNRIAKIAFDPENGSILSLTQGKDTRSIAKSGATGLFAIEFSDGSRLQASDFSSKDQTRSFSYRLKSNQSAEFIYRFNPGQMTDGMTITIQIRASSNFFDFQGTITSPVKTVLDFSLPGRLQFKPSLLNQLISPTCGYDSFGLALLPSFFKKNQSYGTPYPPAFADFFHLDTKAGTASLMAIQPPGKNLFVPGKIVCGGEDSKGYLERSSFVCIKPDETWTSPVVRLLLGETDTEALKHYARENGVKKPLSKKASSAVIHKLKNSLHIKYDGSAREKMEQLPRLPSPNLIHFDDYLHGGFDQGLPKHLPPHPNFGTMEEFRKFYDEAHALGHFVSPYMNASWWNDREGLNPGAFVLDSDQKPLVENYNGHKGWLVSFWQKDTIEAHEEVVKQLTRDFPSDILFQDQFGCRSWHYDRNLSSPAPNAYVAGVLKQVKEDSGKTLLSTEGGFDHIVNSEIVLCGFAFKVVPSPNESNTHVLFKDQYPAGSYRLYPFVQKLCHDKVILFLHNLGQFAKNPESLAWTLALGFSLSYRAHAQEVSWLPVHQWLLWLDRIQKTVCSRYAGKPLQHFEHGKNEIKTSYGTGKNDRIDLSVSLKAPFHYEVQAMGLEGNSSVLVEQTGKKLQISIYEPEGRSVSIPLPKKVPSKKSLPPLTLHHPQIGTDIPASSTIAYRLDSTRKKILFTLPGKEDSTRYLWSAEISSSILKS